jgi:hypothetical protein
MKTGFVNALQQKANAVLFCLACFLLNLSEIKSWQVVFLNKKYKSLLFVQMKEFQK